MAKRLTKLKIREVSAVDSGAGRGVHIVLAKRRPRYEFNDADSLVRVDKAATDSLEKALDEIELNRAVAKAAAPVSEEIMETDVTKAAIAKVNDRIEAIIAKSDKPISRDVAVYRLSQSRDALDQEAWLIHKALAVVPPAPVSAPVMKSEALVDLETLATDLAKAKGLSFGSAFAKVYADPANRSLVDADRAAHLSKVSGAGIDPNESLVVAIMNALGCDRARAAGLALEVRSKNPDPSLLHVTTRDAA